MQLNDKPQRRKDIGKRKKSRQMRRTARWLRKEERRNCYLATVKNSGYFSGGYLSEMLKQ